MSQRSTLLINFLSYNDSSGLLLCHGDTGHTHYRSALFWGLSSIGVFQISEILGMLNDNSLFGIL